MIRFYHMFAEACTFEIRYRAFCFVAWGVGLVEIVQIRDKLWEMIVFVDILCVAGTQLLFPTLVEEAEHGVCALGLSVLFLHLY